MTDYVTLFKERYSTALVSDAAYRAGVALAIAPPGLAPLERRDKLAGPAVTIHANNDLVSTIGAVHNAQAGDVILMTNSLFEVALIGDLIVTEAKRKGLAGFVVDGLLRDVTEILDIGLPVICRGALPIGPLKLPAELKGIGEANVEVTLGEATVRPGDWVFGDADGVIFIAADDLHVVFEQAETSWQREEALAEQIRAGAALGDLFAIDDFLAKRAADPSANFNEHLTELGSAI